MTINQLPLLNACLNGATALFLIAGLMFIIRYIGVNHRYSLLSVAVLLGFAFFEASLIGEIIDLRSSTIPFLKLFEIASLIGIGSFIFVFALAAIYGLILRILNLEKSSANQKGRF